VAITFKKKDLTIPVIIIKIWYGVSIYNKYLILRLRFDMYNNYNDTYDDLVHSYPWNGQQNENSAILLLWRGVLFGLVLVSYLFFFVLEFLEFLEFLDRVFDVRHNIIRKLSREINWKLNSELHKIHKFSIKENPLIFICS
jgi:hypothetical protein